MQTSLRKNRCSLLFARHPTTPALQATGKLIPIATYEGFSSNTANTEQKISFTNP